MYSDTRTLPFQIDGGDAPTQLLDAPTAVAAPRTPSTRSTDGRKGPLVVLLVVGALLLAALLVAIAVLAARGAPAPVAEVPPAPIVDSPAIDLDEVAPPTADVPVVPPPAPQPTNPVIDLFTSSNTTVLCNTQTPVPSKQYISFSWSVSEATRVYFGTDTADASVAPLFDNLPLTGTSTADFPAGYNDFTYNCPNASRTYTLTAIDADGGKTSRSVVIVNEGDTF